MTRETLFFRRPGAQMQEPAAVEGAASESESMLACVAIDWPAREGTCMFQLKRPISVSGPKLFSLAQVALCS